MDAANFYLFTGENSYALGQELQRWKQGFCAKHGAENMVVLQTKECTLSDLLDAVSVMPFIAEKRLVIFEGLPKIEKEDFHRLLEGIHPQTILTIVEAKPDKRLSLVKEIERSAEIKAFPVLSPADLTAWMRSFVQALDCRITPEAEKAILSIVGTDQRMLAMELRKLAAHACGEITIRDVELLAVPSGTQVIWTLTDLIASGKPRDALLFLDGRIQRGEDVYGMWTVLLSMIKNLTLVFAAVNSGSRDDRTIANATGLHFMAVRSLLPLARSMTIDRIRSLVDWAAEADIQLKSGGYHYSADRPHEVIALAEKAIMMTAPHV